MKTNNLQNQINKVINLNSLILKSFAFVMLLTVSLSTITPAFAAVPQSMSYSAVLRDATGTLLSGPYDFKVRYYDASTGGILMYEEEFTTTTINTGGTFFLPLGTGSIITGTFSSINFNSPVFITLNTKPNANPSYDGEMNPRIPLRSVPSALNSQKLDGRIVGGANGIVAYDASSSIQTNNLNASGSINILNNLNIGATTTASSIISTLINSVTGIINKLFLGVLNIGTPSDTILVRDGLSGEVKGISAASLFASNTPTSTLNLQNVTDNGATTTNDITVQNLAGQYTRQGRASFTVGTTYNNNSTRLSFVAPFGTNNNVYLPGIIDGVLALSVNNIQADSNGDIDISPLLTNVGNFATADLTATGNRFHNFNNFGLSINNVTDFELNSQNTGRLSAGGFGSTAQIEYNGSANINMLIGDITQGASSNLSLAKNGIALRSANNLFGYDNELTILNGELNYKNNLTGFDILKANQNGNISFGAYQNSRNDNTGLASSTPVNFLYTNPAGELLSAPLSSIISSTSTNFANADLTANGNRIHDFAGFDLGINAINAFNINATGSSQAYNSLYEVNSEDTRFVSTNSIGLFSGGSMVMSAGNIELNSTAGSTYFNTAGQNVFTANNGNNIFTGTTFPSISTPGFGYSTLITSKGTQKQQFLELYQDATNNSFGIMGGNINPQGNYAARLGSIYFNRDGTSGKAYLKTSNDLLNTGWDRILTLADLASTTSASTTNLLSFSTSTNILSSVVNGIRSTTSLPSTASPITIQNTSSLFATGLPNPAGVGATNADNSNFFGDSAGQNSTNANNSNFFGRFAGNSAINANNSNFLGFVAGARATNAANSNFIGRSAGSDAINSSSSNFIGNGAGSQATNAANANFIGNNAGAFAVNARDSVFIGSNAGLLDTVNNTLGGTSILIGSNTGTGGFSNSIALGANAFNTKTNQFLVGPAYSDFNFRGVNYVFPSTQATGTGKVLTNDGLGNLSWQSAGTTTPTTNLLNFSTSTNILSSNVNGILATTSISNIISPITVRNGNSLFSTGLLNTGGGSVAINSNFFGELAGQGAVNANSSNFFGNVAGESAVNAFNSNFFGGNAGVNAASANNSNFLGKDAGANARNSFNSNFLGQLSGDDATNANNSNFFGLAAGRSATNARNSNFFGLSAGQNSANANNSIFIGNSSGANDTVNNSLNGTSILIGDNTNTGGFSNSIALGSNAINTKTNQFLVGPNYTDFSFRGINYTFPSTQGATGTTLINDGYGVLSWIAGGSGTTTNTLNFSTTTSILTSDINGVTATTSLLSIISNAWNVNGNTGTNPLTDFVGTRDLTDLVFKTNATESMRIGATGTLSVLGLVDTIGAGVNLTLRPKAKITSGGFGGLALLQGGHSGAVGTGGLARLIGGNGGTTSGNGGNVNLLGGTATEGNGGSVSLSGVNGSSLTGTARNGGQVSLAGGAPAFGGVAGRISISGGPGSLSDGGIVQISGGLGTTGFAGGNTSIRSGASFDGNAGNLVLGGAVGTGVTGNGGNVIIGGGSVTSSGITGATIFASAIQSDTAFIERMRLASNGNFGIGTNAPTERLQVGDAGSLGNILVFGTGSTCSIGNGVGATLCSSDERLKYDIATSTSNLEKILSLRSVNYKWNTNLNRSSSTQLGLIAQEVEKVFPGYVSVVYDGMKGVDYAALVTPLIGSVQELNAKLTALETRTNASSANSGVGSYTDMIASLTSKLQDGSLDIIVNNIKANKVETKELCLEDVCISKAQFIQMLQSSGVTQNGSSNNTNNNPTPTLLICTLPQVINVSGTACETPVIIDPVTPTVDPAPSTDSNASSTTP